MTTGRINQVTNLEEKRESHPRKVTTHFHRAMTRSKSL